MKSKDISIIYGNQILYLFFNNVNLLVNKLKVIIESHYDKYDDVMGIIFLYVQDKIDNFNLEDQMRSILNEDINFYNIDKIIYFMFKSLPVEY